MPNNSFSHPNASDTMQFELCKYQMKLWLKENELRREHNQIIPALYNALYEAVIYRQPEVVKLLLRQGVNAAGTDGTTPHHFFNPYKPIINAILNDDLETVKILVQYGADYSTRDFTPTALVLDFMRLAPPVYKEYQERFSKIKSGTLFSPFSLATYLNKTEIVNYLEHLEQARIKNSLSVKGGIMLNPNETDNAEFPFRP